MLESSLYPMHKLKTYLFSVTDKLGKRLKIDATFITKSTFWISFGRFSWGLSAFVITLVLSRFMSQEAFGMYKYILSLAAAISAFSFSGLGTAISQASAKNKDGIYTKGFKQGLIWSTPALIIGVGVGAYYVFMGNNQLGLAVLFTTITNLFLQSTLIWSNFLIGKRLYKEDGINSTIYGTSIALITIFATLWYPSPFIVSVVYTAGAALISFYLYKKTMRHVKNDELAKEEMSFGKQMSFLQIIGSLSTQADKLVIFHLLGVAPLAIYSVATALPQQLRFGSKLISSLSLPKYSTQTIGSIKKSIHKQAFYVLIFSICCVVAYVLLSPYFFKLFFPRYIEGIFLSQIFSLIFLVFPITLYQQVLSSHRKIKSLAFIQTIAPITKIVSLLIFVPLYGLWGVLISVFIMELFRGTTVLCTFSRLKD